MFGATVGDMALLTSPHEQWLGGMMEVPYSYEATRLAVAHNASLGAQTLNERNEVIEQISFSDVRIGERIDRSALKSPWSTDGWSVVRSEYRQADLAKLGWIVPTPDGFRRTKEVVRRMHSAEAMQVVFADGAVLPYLGASITLRLRAAGGVQSVATTLSWDAAVVTPLGAAAGPLATG